MLEPKQSLGFERRGGWRWLVAVGPREVDDLKERPGWFAVVAGAAVDLVGG
jgi:hypothetical protein